MTYAERERRRLSWRLRLGLGEPEELEEEEERELEEPERLEPDELDPLEEPELEPELLLEVELDLDLDKTKKNMLGKKKRRILSLTQTLIIRCNLKNKPAAGASRGTAAFPRFLPSSLLVSFLGTSLFFASVFCLFLLLPLCG